MAFEIGGRTYRVSADWIYLNDRRIREIYVNGEKCYPEVECKYWTLVHGEVDVTWVFPENKDYAFAKRLNKRNDDIDEQDTSNTVRMVGSLDLVLNTYHPIGAFESSVSLGSLALSGKHSTMKDDVIFNGSPTMDCDEILVLGGAYGKVVVTGESNSIKRALRRPYYASGTQGQSVKYGYEQHVDAYMARTEHGATYVYDEMPDGDIVLCRDNDIQDGSSPYYVVISWFENDVPMRHANLATESPTEAPTYVTLPEYNVVPYRGGWKQRSFRGVGIYISYYSEGPNYLNINNEDTYLTIPFTSVVDANYNVNEATNIHMEKSASIAELGPALSSIPYGPKPSWA